MTEKRPQRLWEITADMQVLDMLMEENDIDSPEVEQALAEWASEIQGNMADKVDNYAALISQLLAQAEARKAEAKRLADRAKADVNKADRLKEHLKRTLEFLNIKTVDTPRYKVTVATAGGKAPVECNVLPEDLPPEFQKIKTEISVNKDAIREKLQDGVEIPGCRLAERGKYLKIS